MTHKMYDITTREEYEYALKNGYDALVDKNFRLDNRLRRLIQRERFGKNDAEGNERFYRYCWERKPHYCEECLVPLYGYSATYVSHIISRGADARMAHDARNIMILCPKCHEMYEHITTRRGMRTFKKSERIKEELRKDYQE